MHYHISGSSKPAPAGGHVLTARVNHTTFEWLGPIGSPHRAVWKGCHEAVRDARARGLESITIHTRNAVVRNQATGSWNRHKMVLDKHVRKFRRLTRGMTVAWAP